MSVNNKIEKFEIEENWTESLFVYFSNSAALVSAADFVNQSPSYGGGI